jgi:DnaJ-class molecular chaperone
MDIKKNNYYDILGIPKNASLTDIKKAYKQKALLHHPDRNEGNKESEETFKNISVAYQILSDTDKRNLYDINGTTDDINLDTTNIFNEIFKSQINTLFGNNANLSPDMLSPDMLSPDMLSPDMLSPDMLSPEIGGIKFSFHSFVNPIINENVTDKFENVTNTLKNAIKNMNIGDILNDSNLFDNKNNIPIKKKEPKIKYQTKKNIFLQTPPDLIYNIRASLEDIYTLKTKTIKIDRYRKKIKKSEHETKKVKIPLYGRTIRLTEQGNQLEGYIDSGDLIIQINDIQHNRFKRINEGDLIITQNINLSDIYNGTVFDIIHLDKSKLKIKCNKRSLLNQEHFIQKIKKKGLPYYDENKKRLTHGHLYIRYIIILPDENPITEQNKIDDIVYNEKVYIAQNCDYNQVYCDTYD